VRGKLATPFHPLARPSPLCMPMLRTRCGYCPKNCICNMQRGVVGARGRGVCVCLDWVAAFFCVFYALNAAFVTATYPIPFPSLRAINIAAALSPKWILRYFCRFRFTQPGKILPKILIGRIRLNCECDYFQRYCS